jgi:hypothetical protein
MPNGCGMAIVATGPLLASVRQPPWGTYLRRSHLLGSSHHEAFLLNRAVISLHPTRVDGENGVVFGAGAGVRRFAGRFQRLHHRCVYEKGTPAEVVTDRTKADYVLHSSAVSVHQESNTGKVVRCLFASCAGIQDTSTVTVELINIKTSGIEWSYTVHKQRGGGYNQQSMAEAIAKHLKFHLEGKGG